MKLPIHAFDFFLALVCRVSFVIGTSPCFSKADRVVKCHDEWLFAELVVSCR